MAGVTLEHVTKTFGDVVAVNDLNLEIVDGEFLVLVGPSGCGKTTALRLVAGLEEITAGSIAIGGRRVEDVPPKDRDIAMVFQSYALYPHMSVFDNMAFGLKLRNLAKPEIARRVGETAALLGLDQLLKRKPKELSGGQRQRVALGRAIVRNPQVFLMDEPLSNLDAQLRVQTRTELIKLHQRLQTTTIYVTHDQVEAMTMGSRIAVMRDGLLQQLDTPTNLYEHPVNVFVAGFIGSPRMNFFNGELVAEGGQLWAQASDVRLTLPADHPARRSERASGSVTLGVRPEDLHIAFDEGDVVGGNGRTTMMQVSLVENMGAEQLVHLSSDGLEFIARSTARRAPAPGDTVPVVFDTEHLHVFDAATERALS